MGDIYYAVAHRDQAEIDSFKTRYADFPTELIPEIFKTSLGMTVLHWEPCRSFGTAHVIYYVSIAQEPTEFILRANLGFGSPEVVMLVEKLVTDRVAALGVPVNVVRFADVTRKKYPFDFQIEERLTGVDLEGNFTGTKDEYDRLSLELGMYVARYHELTFNKFGRFSEVAALKGNLRGSKKQLYDYMVMCLENDIDYLVGDGVVTKATGKRIQKLFAEYKPITTVPRGVLVHHDLADHNIMFVGNHITGIFDWEACVVGDPVLDLASCPTWKTHHPREEKLLEGYTSVRPLPEHFTEKRNIYLLRTMLWKMVFAIRAHHQSPKRTQKFQEALAPFKLKIRS